MDIEAKFREAVEQNKFKIDTHVKAAVDHLEAARKLSEDSGVPFSAHGIDYFSVYLDHGDFIPSSLNGDLDSNLVEELTGVLPWDPSDGWDDSGCVDG